MSSAFAVVARTAVTVLLLLSDSPSQAAEDYEYRCQNAAPAALPSGPFSVLTINASHGRGTALNQLLVSTQRIYSNLDKLSALLARYVPDLVAVQEADAPSRWSGGFDHPGYLATAADYRCVLHGYHSKKWIATYGTALLSNVAPVAVNSERFAPSWPSKQKGYVLATYEWPVLQPPVLLSVVSVHLDFLRRRTRDRQVQQMIDELRVIEGPLVVLGDFNSAWNDDGSAVRSLAEALGLRPYAADAASAGTYKALSGERYDWVLISADLDYAEYRTLADVVSDHLAVYAELRYKGE